MRLRRLSLLAIAIVCVPSAAIADEATFQVEKLEDRFVITHGERPVATYVFRDEKILRPYFAHVHAPDGTQVTRHHPPRQGIDAVDHDTMHPGIWLAFGDLDGVDFWRNKGEISCRPISRPVVKRGIAFFGGTNSYQLDGREVCWEECPLYLQVLADGYLLVVSSRFHSVNKAPLVFGDQEEMGLGLRLATPLVVKGGSGTITNSEGGKNEKEVWGKQADWCDYSGVLEKDGKKRRVGMLVVPHKDNFRRSWFHVRDYGLLVANPFGQNAFTMGEKSRVEVKPGEQLDLRFAVWIYSADAASPPDLATIAKECQQLMDRR